MSRQLALPVALGDGARLDNFLPEACPEAHAALLALLAGDESLLWVWGASGSGRSHLLAAAADTLYRRGLPVTFIDFDGGTLPDPGLVADVGGPGLVCLDRVDRVAGDARWEEALFHLFNRLRAAGGRLLASADAPPAAVPFALPDLASRLRASLVVALPAPDDAARLAILGFRAARRGLELPPETGRYLLAHGNRDLHALMTLLDRLDRAALEQQRRLTVPFVRQVLAG